MNEAPSDDGVLIAATFTADPVIEFIQFYADLFSVSLAVEVAPYAQVHRQLLDPDSEFRKAAGRDRFLLVRWADIAAQPLTSQSCLVAARELVDALSAQDGSGSVTIFLFPHNQNSSLEEDADSFFVEAFANRDDINVIAARDVFDSFDALAPFDRRADKIGHIPYTPEGFAAIGGAIARQHFLKRRTAPKVFAVDGDNTLWRGVLGERGANGIKIDGGDIALQKKLQNQVHAGRMVSIVSKNDEADIRSLFKTRGDFPLSYTDTIANKINWSPKPHNIAALAEELNIGVDAIVFIDDSPVEIAQMRAAAPDVTSVRAPQDASAMEAFVRHFWPFDIASMTTEDEQRLKMYRDANRRKEIEREAASFGDFIRGLNLSIKIFPISDNDIARASQLTKRTNQFNINLVRVDEQDLKARQDQTESFLFGVNVSDRFGDYGVVGLIGAKIKSQSLCVDLFMLSCRALGRGVEHEMAAFAGELALEKGFDNVVFEWRVGPRNEPAAQFLAGLTGKQPADIESIRMPANIAATARFDPDASNAYSRDGKEKPTAVKIKMAEDNLGGSGVNYEYIATSLTTAKAIVNALAERRRDRPAMSVPYIAPSQGLESDIVSIWEDVLNVAPIGVNDAFQEIGGKSIHLVRVHTALADKLNIEMDLVTLFECRTVKDLARRLSGAAEAAPVTDAAGRAEKMRAARNRAANADPAGRRKA